MTCIRKDARGRCYNVVDPVNDLDAEHPSGRRGRTAVRFTRRDFVILDELGHLPFAPFCPGAGGHLPFHLMSRFDERTSIVVTTNLAFGEWPSMHDCGNVGSLDLDDYQMKKYTPFYGSRTVICDPASC